MGFYYPNGLSQKAGAHYLLTKPIYTSERVRYVDSVNGSDTYEGTYYTPKATVASAEAEHSSRQGGIIVLKTGHDETVTAALNINAGVTIVGETSSGGIPDASLTLNSASVSLTTPLQGHQFANVKLPAMPTANASASRLDYASPGSEGFRMVDCYVEFDVNDNALAPVSCDDGFCERTTHVSTATSPTTQTQQYGIGWSNSYLTDCVFDMGPSGGRSTDEDGFIQASALAIRTALLHGASIDTDASTYLHTTESVFDGGYMELSTNKVQGPLIAGAADILLSGQFQNGNEVYFVDSANGSDAATGTVEDPWATLAYAITQTAADDMIVLRSGFSETVSTTLTITDVGLTIVGEDATVVLDIQTTATAGVSVTSDYVRIRNVSFKSTSGTPTALITTDNMLVQVYNCTFDIGATVTTAGFEATSGSVQCWLEDCTFTSSATTVATRATAGVYANALTGILIKNCVFDGGTVGWDTGGIVSNGVAHHIRAEGITLKNGADVFLSTVSTGYLQIESADANCTVETF